MWRIPVWIGGVAGEVLSAEMDEGATPLLLSIPAMKALDFVIYMRQEMVQAGALGVQFPMVTTSTRHLAVNVSVGSAAEARPLEGEGPVNGEDPALAEDLMIYYAEEARYPLLSLAYFANFAVGPTSRRRPTWRRVGSDHKTR